MGRIIAGIYERTRGRRWLWALAAIVVAALAVWSASRARFGTDLFDALPDDPAMQHYRALLEAGGAQGHIAVGFTGAGGMDSTAASADRFVEAIRAHAGLVDSAFCRPDLAWADALMAGVDDRLPLLADAGRLAWLAGADSLRIDSAVAAVRTAIAAPGGEFGVERLLADPFGLAAPLRERMLATGTGGGPSVIDGVLFSADSTMAVALLWPTTEGLKKPADLVRAIDEAIATSCADGVHGAAFGAAPMAEANRTAIARDAWRTSVVALLLVVIILLWYYRDRRTLPLFLLPPLFGFVVGVGALAAFRTNVSGLALGASAALLGIALDYAFHFLTHLRHRGNVAATLREVSAPMLLGCITTVLAFGALSLASSRVLADLGLIAAFMLVGALFMVLLVLPHFVPARLQRMADAAGTAPVGRERPGRWIPLLAIAGVTVVLLPYASRVQQEQDPEHLSLTPDDVRLVRDKLEGTGDRSVPVFIAGMDKDAEHARRRLEAAIAAVRGTEGVHAEGLLPIDLSPSDSTMALREHRWAETFAGEQGRRIERWTRAAAVRNGFEPDAFDGFLSRVSEDQILNGGPAVNMPGGLSAVHDDGAIEAVRLLVPPSEVAAVERAVAGMHGVEVMHRGLLGRKLAQVAEQDLSGILWRTAGIVFLALLITYGRIELALITFLPMALGWVWILGICGLLGIRFDPVNIMVCTFIFGLGDDYCIFTTEGLLARYRTGSDHTRSFRSAVVLSAVTTIIGTGALFLASHPALRSIAVLSVVGMATLLLVSLTVQPVLFGLLIGDRAEKGRQPFTALSLLISVFAFLYFLSGCILLSVAWLLFMLVPAPKRMKQHWTRCIIRLFTGSLVYVMANVRKDIRSFAPALKDGPAIVIANHASFIDILAMLMITPRAVMMTNRWVWNSPFFGRVVRYAGFLRSEDGTERNVERARELLAQGISIIIFPEGTRSRDGRIGRFHKGAFHIAEALGAPIVPVLLHGFGEAMGKSDALLKNTTITMRPLPAIPPGDPRFGTGDRERTKAIAKHFKAEYEKLRTERETPRWFIERLSRTFTYKGPALEWHTRIKARMDGELHDLLHARIGRDARITDLGAGHGMVALLLHWAAPGRSITAIERDAEKTALAGHAARHWPGIRVEEADLRSGALPEADAILLKDVLHYMPPTDQRDLLLRCAKALAPGGSIYVRDGFRSDDARHERTRWTERIAVAIGFNKAEGTMHFMSRDEFQGMAGDAGLAVEWAQAAHRTSNELAILTRT
ncbi:MAG: 1-acyl-sn-glycerol-3-phosphate acyltransferase [Flavobacteriales bacterium]|nr:1-acyl-sn-glycerol-3-phosphate acyltransferase [Flavobacteriales bacterium]